MHSLSLGQALVTSYGEINLCGMQVMGSTGPLLLQQQQLQQLMIQIGQHHMQHGSTMFNPFVHKAAPDNGARSFSRANSSPLADLPAPEGREGQPGTMPQVSATSFLMSHQQGSVPQIAFSHKQCQFRVPENKKS